MSTADPRLGPSGSTSPAEPAAGPAFPGLARASLAAIVANIAIIVTGGVVRITGSGLGCPDWPTCEGGSVVPQASTAEWHTFIEFGNRLMTFVVLGVAVWVVLAARREARGRRGIWRLALVQPVGVLVQAVIGGVTVLTGLSPLVVATHLVASMVLVAAAVALHDRATVGTGPPADDVAPLRPLTAFVVVAAAAVVVIGTLVTASGPHSGGEPGTQRLGLDIRTVAVLHADAVWLLLGATVAVLVVARVMGARRAQRAVIVLLGLELAQGALGYAQYALGVPPVPVLFHLLGAALVWTAAWRLAMAVRPFDVAVADPNSGADPTVSVDPAAAVDPAVTAEPTTRVDPSATAEPTTSAGSSADAVAASTSATSTSADGGSRPGMPVEPGA